ncbi:transmembrane protease serine 13b isoform X1 [Electrophorus electricus]|uniref:transmembrane protease serine 13b isoform X1 n=1 Tax=Electrophorus electricus TaxID=8005 RepID=UPI0015D030C0|nr:transmembrane protease serine 13b isoform X1 [Electrophorus electricus]
MEDTQAQLQGDENPPPYFLVVKPTEPPPPYFGLHPLPSSPPFEPFYVNQPLPQIPPPNLPLPVAASSQNNNQTAPPPASLVMTGRRRARCYGCSGGSLLILVIIGIVIWLGVRYGPLLLSKETDKVGDTCPSTTVKCDGHTDCTQGSDETNCVRFGTGNELQVLTSSSRVFLPVCSVGWSQSLADQTCHQLGFRRSYHSGTELSTSLSFLSVSNQSTATIQGKVQVSSSCPGQKVATLQCTSCGDPYTSKIIGGTVAEQGQWPWQTSLHFQGWHTCGGSLVAQDFVVTAAHCFPKDSASAQLPSNWLVYLGTVSQYMLPEPLYVAQIIVHEEYNPKTSDYDIALLKLSRPVIMSNVVKPVCLPAFDMTVSAGTQCWTSGFGTTQEGAAEGSTNLMQVAVDIIDSGVCNSAEVYNGRITQNMLCAGYLTGGRDSCQGDSGGPLVCQETDGHWYLTGITSWGYGCGREDSPGVYSDVHSLLGWIYSKMERSHDCGLNVLVATVM